MNAPSEDAEIAVVGAGVIGLACALRLAHDGADVVLIDRDAPGRGCSFGNAAHIATELVFPLASPQTLLSAPGLVCGSNSPLRIDPAYGLKAAPWLLRFAKSALPHNYKRGVAALSSLQSIAGEETRNLLQSANAESLLRMDGHLMLVEDARSLRRIERLRQEEKKHGVLSEWMEPADVAGLAPDLTGDIAGAVFYPETGHVLNPYSVCLKLLEAFEQAGGCVIKNEIDQIKTLTPAGFAFEGASGSVKADKVIIAAGAWSHRLAKQLGCNAPLEAERGYHVTAPAYQPKMTKPVSSFERNVIMTPLDEGLRITGFVELAGLEKPARQKNIEKLKSHMQALTPHLDLAGATSWLGHRPTLPDYLPVIGATRKCNNAFFAFGHQHLGLTLAGVTAAMMGDIIKGKTPPVDPAPFSIDRF